MGAIKHRNRKNKTPLKSKYIYVENEWNYFSHSSQVNGSYDIKHTKITNPICYANILSPPNNINTNERS